MSTENWVSIDTDIEITSKRWKNHVEGTIKFDEDNNTVLGIEVRITLCLLHFLPQSLPLTLAIYFGMKRILSSELTKTNPL